MTPEALEDLLGGIERELLSYHDANPKATGIAALALRDRVDRRLDPKVFDALLALGVGCGSVALSAGEVRHPKAASTAIAEEEAARAAIVPALQRAALSPGTVAALAAEIEIDAGVVRKALTKRVAEARSFASAPTCTSMPRRSPMRARRSSGSCGARHDACQRRARRHGSSRKYIVPLLEYFDSQGITKRDGDIRTLGRLG